MDTFIPNMTLANNMHNTSNIIFPFPVSWYTHSLVTECPSTTLTLLRAVVGHV